MIAAVRAISDRFIYDCAHVKHLITAMEPAALDAGVPGSDWNARQLAGHLATSLETYDAILGRWFNGERAIPDDWDPNVDNAHQATRYRDATVEHLVDDLDATLPALISSLARMDDEWIARPIGWFPAIDALTAWSDHIRHHGAEIAARAGDLANGPLVAGWLRESHITKPEAQNAP